MADLLTAQISTSQVDVNNGDIFTIEATTEQGISDIFYTDPVLAPPNPSGPGLSGTSGGGNGGSQVVIYNDPRSAIEAILSLGLQSIL